MCFLTALTLQLRKYGLSAPNNYLYFAICESWGATMHIYETVLLSSTIGSKFSSFLHFFLERRDARVVKNITARPVVYILQT